jgi:hypothetical protein
VRFIELSFEIEEFYAFEPDISSPLTAWKERCGGGGGITPLSGAAVSCEP